ncbi:MAG: polysaccharide pyruvyl transferase CsaB [Clostridia bacterium]|nr:polysaccharide pyruvyl transferase CsaB [Clostridia bacterium]
MKKILLATMALDIGGAETHVVELAGELKRRGYDVSVASGGGVYESALAVMGIRHFKLPLHRKRAMLTAERGLGRLIKREKFDIVHAHARIPAYICGRLRKRMDFGFAVTCHGVYKVSPLWKSMSNWGDLTLGVSCDIKDYLIENYRLPSDNITLTINGIDTRRFSRESDGAAIEAELSLTGEHRIIYVSRIDKECALTAFQLAEAAPRLIERYPDLEMVLVGQGTAFAELSEKVAAFNADAGREVIKLTGARTDIDKFMACGDLFVGVSRSALEAMSAELPVILSGAQGYLGVFDESVLDASLATNFCCRGYGDSTVEAIVRDICDVFERTPDERAAMGAYNRAVVEREYSISRMAEDAIGVYDALELRREKKPSSVILGGYYGFGNMGDDSLLQLVIERLRERCPDAGITVLSKKPRETAKVFGVRSVNRFNLLALFMEMKRAKALIYGGGSILQTNSSSRSLFYYTFVMKMAKRLGLSVMLWGNGIGPITGEGNIKRAKDALAVTNEITLREKASLAELAAFGVDVSRARVTADPAFALKPADENWVIHIMERMGIDPSGEYFTVAPRRWSRACPDFEEKCASICAYVKEKYRLSPIYIAMQPSRDLAICERLAQKVDGVILSGLSARELLGIVGRTRLALAMRLHGLIYAISSGVPAVGLSYDPKIDAMLDMAGLPYRADVRDLDAGAVCAMVDEIMAKREKLSAALLAVAEDLRKATYVDAEIAAKLLEK